MRSLEDVGSDPRSHRGHIPLKTKAQFAHPLGHGDHDAVHFYAEADLHGK